MKNKLKRIKDNVAEILNIYPESRANDNYLFKNYLKVYHEVQLPEIEATVNFETLTRARRYWQARGMYLPLDASIEEARKKAEIDYKETFSSNKAKASGF